MTFIPPNKKAQQEVGVWKANAKYIILAIAFLIIIYIVLKMIIARLKNLYF